MPCSIKEISTFGRLMVEVKRYIILHFSQHRTRFERIDLWRRDMFGLNSLNAYLTISGVGSARFDQHTEVCIFEENKTKTDNFPLQSNKGHRKYFHGIYKSMSVLQKCLIYIESTRYSSPMASSDMALIKTTTTPSQHTYIWYRATRIQIGHVITSIRKVWDGITYTFPKFNGVKFICQQAVHKCQQNTLYGMVP